MRLADMMDSSVTIRAATHEDLPALGRLGASLMTLHYRFDERRFLPPGERPDEGYAWFLGSQLDQPDVVVLVAERDPARDAVSRGGVAPGGTEHTRAGDSSADQVSMERDRDQHRGAQHRGAEHGVPSTPHRVVGYVYAGLEPLSWKELRGPAGFIHDLIVDETSRHTGVGSALMNAALSWLRDKGAPRIMLWTAEQNADAQRLFAARGFRRTMIEMTLEL